MRVLLTNDDGVFADGLLALKTSIELIADVFVVAPERQRSATGHAITLHKPLRLIEVALADGSKAYSSNGTPADCVSLGVQEIMSDKVDLVISGINHGPNLGWDVHYSGTVSAALEAVMIGHQSFAISVASFDLPINWSAAAQFARRLALWLNENPLPRHCLLNVNVPNLDSSQITGVCATRQGPRQYVDRIDKRQDPIGRPYYWLGGTLADHDSPEGTDVRAIADNRISVSPLHLDLTAQSLIERLRELEL